MWNPKRDEVQKNSECPCCRRLVRAPLKEGREDGECRCNGKKYSNGGDDYDGHDEVEGPEEDDKPPKE